MGTCASTSLHTDEERNFKCSGVSILQLQETNHVADRCKYKRSWYFKHGLGTCLLQEDKPVYFASKALTDAQRGYVAIELESLTVSWTMEKFHHFYMPAILY